ncbi:30S ribosomal protein S17 [Candidatus Woesearchaeota archaeon]|nr:30S ribosomal protein S17 [Candidatus Woesearchaeota archaeon]
METAKNIGMNVTRPKEGDAKDVKCPFFGSLKVRGRTFTGRVTSAKMHKTVVVEWSRRHYLPKYERYEKRKTKIKAHNPTSINAKENDIVQIAECRPLSKTKHFVVVAIVGKHHMYDEVVEDKYAGKGKRKTEEPATEKETQETGNDQ